MYSYKRDIQKKRYEYKKIRRVGTIRGNGMFFEVDSRLYPKVVKIVKKIADYEKSLSFNILDEIKDLPASLQTFLYWMIISSDNEKLANFSAKKLYPP